MSKKIYIAGTSGAGKTTLAEYISKRYRIPFVSLSSKELWPKFGVRTHAELIQMANENPEKGVDFQWQLLELRNKKLENLGEYVTDRSPLDNLVYYMIQCSSHQSGSEVSAYISACSESYPGDFTQIYLTCNPTTIENDGYRINNPYYQVMVDILFMYYLKEGYLSHLDLANKQVKIITDWDWEKRVKIVEKTINNHQGIWQNIKTRLRL